MADQFTSTSLNVNAYVPSPQHTAQPSPAAMSKLTTVSSEPTGDIPVSMRVRQMLHTHQGRDKCFKVIQYLIRLRLWQTGVQAQFGFVHAEEKKFTTLEENLMTITNVRRMFRVGRFLAEFGRAQVAFQRCSELVFAEGSATTMMLLQLQMLMDISGRLLMCVKSVLDDLAWASRKGFLHSDVDSKFDRIATRLNIPITVIDLVLNTMRLLQKWLEVRQDANDSPQMRSPSDTGPGTISLLTAYDNIDKMRRSSSTGTLHTRSASEFSSSFVDSASAKALSKSANANNKVLSRFLHLLRNDFELHWVGVTQVRLILELIVAIAAFRGPSSLRHFGVILSGLFAAVLSVYRVWIYGR